MFFALGRSPCGRRICHRASYTSNESNTCRADARILWPTRLLTHRRVEFRDTDTAGITHFSVFFVWMEQAEHAALRDLGLSVHSQNAVQGTISWPRVSAAACDYRSPVRFEDLVQIEVRISELGTRSVTYNIEFSCEDRPVAIGRITTVCCQLMEDGRWSSIPIPADVRSRLATLAE